MRKLETASFEEVVAQLSASTENRHCPAEAAGGLHVCQACASRLVYPTSWEQAGDDCWQVALRCPSCEWSGVGRFEQRLVDELERELERGDADLGADLALLPHANMVDEIDRFARALDADAIQPFDF